MVSLAGACRVMTVQNMQSTNDDEFGKVPLGRSLSDLTTPRSPLMPPVEVTVKMPTTSHEVQWSKIEAWLQSAGKPNEQAMKGEVEGDAKSMICLAVWQYRYFSLEGGCGGGCLGGAGGGAPGGM